MGVGEGVVRGECKGRECEEGGSGVRGIEGMGSFECEGMGVGRSVRGEWGGECEGEEG